MDGNGVILLRGSITLGFLVFSLSGGGGDEITAAGCLLTGAAAAGVRDLDVEPDLEAAEGEQNRVEADGAVAVGRRGVVGLGDGVLERAVRAVVRRKRLREGNVFDEGRALDGQESAENGLRA